MWGLVSLFTQIKFKYCLGPTVPYHPYNAKLCLLFIPSIADCALCLLLACHTLPTTDYAMPFLFPTVPCLLCSAANLIGFYSNLSSAYCSKFEFKFGKNTKFFEFEFRLSKIQVINQFTCLDQQKIVLSGNFLII